MAYLVAKKINLAAGGTVVAPWEVELLPQEWIDAALALTDGLPEMQAGQQKVEEIVNKWRANYMRRGYVS